MVVKDGQSPKGLVEGGARNLGGSRAERGPPLKARRTSPPLPHRVLIPHLPSHFPTHRHLHHHHPTITAIATHFVAVLFFLTSQSVENPCQNLSKMVQGPSPRRR